MIKKGKSLFSHTFIIEISECSSVLKPTMHRRWTLLVPLGYPDNPSKFVPFNAILSVLFAYYHILFLEGEDPATFRMFSFYSRALSENEQLEVGLFIEKHLSTFLSVVPQNLHTKSIDVIFDFLKEKIPFCDNSGYFSLESQINVFDTFSGCWLYSNPPDFNQNLKQLFFLARYSDAKIQNVEVVLNLDSFFRSFGIFCFFL